MCPGLPRCLSLTLSEAARALALAVVALAASASPAEAQPGNRFVNPEFDNVLTPWVSTGGLSAVDANACAGSGSANVPFSLPVLSSYVAQCVAVTEGETLHAAMQARASRSLVAGFFRFWFRSDPLCAGADVQTIESALSPLDTTWQRFEGSATVPIGASSVGVFAYFGSVLSSSPADIWADRAWLGSAPQLFFDGFEIELACRWSTTISE